MQLNKETKLNHLYSTAFFFETVIQLWLNHIDTSGKYNLLLEKKSLPVLDSFKEYKKTIRKIFSHQKDEIC